MMRRWNHMIRTINWIFYALMRALIPGGVVLHFFGVPYGGALMAFSLVMVGFAYRRRGSLQPIETACWLIAAAAISFWQFDLILTRQWVMVLIYGLWILNQRQLDAYMISGAFGKSLLISFGIIFVVVTATPMVGWEETYAFIRWSIPLYLLSAALMMVRINLMRVYRQRNGHQMNREKNLLLFNGISILFFAIGGTFLFSAWLPPAWTLRAAAAMGKLIEWILYPLAVVLAKGTQILKQLILALNPGRASQGPTEVGLPEGNSIFESRESIIPFMDWAGWILLAGLLIAAILVTLKRSREGAIAKEDQPQAEEKSFLSLQEIFGKKEKRENVKVQRKREVSNRYRLLFGRWIGLLDQRSAFLTPSMTPNQIAETVSDMGINKEESGAIVDIYNRVRYRGDEARAEEEEKMEIAVRQLEESRNIQ